MTYKLEYMLEYLPVACVARECIGQASNADTGHSHLTDTEVRHPIYSPSTCLKPAQTANNVEQVFDETRNLEMHMNR